MSFHPDDIAAREFFPAPDGYDRGEVRAYLRTVASQQRELLAKLDELSQGESADVGGDIDRIMGSARQAAEQLLRTADQEARNLRRRAEEEAAMLRTSTETATHKLRSEAEIYVENIRSAVEQEANERLSHLARRADRVLAGEARIRDRMFSLETTLQTLRGEMQTDAEVLYPELPDALGRMREFPEAAAQGRQAIQPPPPPPTRRETPLRDPEGEPEIVINLAGGNEQ